MIKKIYLGTFCTLFAVGLSAQPTIAFEDFSLEYGTQISLRGASTTIEIGECGEDQTWDYSDLNPSGAVTLRIQTVQPPEGQPAYETYPTATHVYEALNVSNTYSDYKRYGDNKLEMLGIHYNPR